MYSIVVGSERRLVRDIAKQRITLLFKLGEEEVRRGRVDLARRYGELIYRIAAKANVKIPKPIKRRICRKCKVILIPGLTMRVRIQSEGSRGSRVVVTCLKCGWIRRYYIKTGKTKG